MSFSRFCPLKSDVEAGFAVNSIRSGGKLHVILSRLVRPRGESWIECVSEAGEISVSVAGRAVRKD